jgi:hypothetical protein
LGFEFFWLTSEDLLYVGLDRVDIAVELHIPL